MQDGDLGVTVRQRNVIVLEGVLASVTPVVRTPGFDPAFILRLLDMGVQGIQLPHVNDAETALKRPLLQHALPNSGAQILDRRL